MEWISPQESEVESKSEEETAGFAQAFARSLRAGDTICLHGNLGMGKSVFARALIRTLTGNPEQEVPSPTFTLLQTYDTPMGEVWHFDLYRLKDPEEVYELGWEEALAGTISIIEWPERLGYLLPADRIDIHLSATPRGSRLLQVEARGAKKDLS